MKIRLTESQYKLIELLNEAGKVPYGYGIEPLIKNITKNSKIRLDIEMSGGEEIDLPINGKETYSVVSMSGSDMKLMRIDNNNEYIYDLTNFDNGSITLTKTSGNVKTPQDFKLLSILKIEGNNVVAKIIPQSFNPSKQAKNDKDEVDSQRNDFIDKLKGFSDGDGIEFKGNKNIEFKIVGGGSNSSVRMKPVSKDFKMDKEAEGIVIKFDDITYDKGTNEVTLKYYEYNGTNVMSSKEIGGITGLVGVTSSDDIVDSEELEELRGLLLRGEVGEVFKFGDYEFEVVKKNKQGFGIGLKPKDKKTKEFLINILKTINEADDDLVFFIKPENLKEKNGKVLMVGQVFHNKVNKPVNLGDFSFDTIDSIGDSKKSSEDDTSDKKDDSIKPKVSRARMKKRLELVRNNPILLQALKRSEKLNKGKEFLDSINNRIDDKLGSSTEWMNNFKYNEKVIIKILSDSFKIKSDKDTLNFDKGSTYKMNVGSKKETVLPLTSGKPRFNLVLSNKISGNEYEGVIVTFDSIGVKQQKRIKVEVKK